MGNKIKNDAESIAVAFRIIFERLKKENKKQEDERMKFAIRQKVVREATKEVFTIREARITKEGVFYFVEDSDVCYAESCFEEVQDISISDLYTGDLVVCVNNIIWKVLKDTLWGDIYVAPTPMGIKVETDLNIVKTIRPSYLVELLDDHLKEMNKKIRWM